MCVPAEAASQLIPAHARPVGLVIMVSLGDLESPACHSLLQSRYTVIYTYIYIQLTIVYIHIYIEQQGYI